MATKLWEPTGEQGMALYEFSENVEHYLNDFKNIRKRYAGMFVAIWNQQVFASSKSVDGLLSLIEQKIPDKKKARQALLTYVPHKNEIRIA